MTTKPRLLTGAEIRARNTKLAGVILNQMLAHAYEASDCDQRGTLLYDEQLVVTAATVHAAEAEMRGRGEATSADGKQRSKQYADSAARQGI